MTVNYQRKLKLNHDPKHEYNYVLINKIKVFEQMKWKEL